MGRAERPRGSRLAAIARARGALVGVAAVSGLSIAGSLVGFVFQVILAARFGAGAAIDGYLFAISAPAFLAGLGAAALSYMAVPALVAMERDAGARAALLRALLRRVALVSVAFLAVGVPAAVVQPLLLPASARLAQLPELRLMVPLGWAIGGAQLLAALFTVELNAARRPITAALLSLPPNLGAIAVVLLAPRTILAAPAGVLFGSLVALALGIGLTRPSFRRQGGAGDGATQRIAAGRVGWTLLAMSCFSAYAVIDAFWAPRAGAGTLAGLGYAQRLVIGIGALILAGPSAILTPRFAARLRDEGARAFLREVARTVVLVAGAALAAAVILAVAAGPMIEAVFRRGAFGAGDVARVTAIFRSMLPGFAAMLVSVVLTRAIYCLAGVERTMAVVGVAWSVIYFAGCGLLMAAGGVGFGISYSAAWFLYLAIALAVVRHYGLRAARDVAAPPTTVIGS